MLHGFLRAVDGFLGENFALDDLGCLIRRNSVLFRGVCIKAFDEIGVNEIKGHA